MAPWNGPNNRNVGLLQSNAKNPSSLSISRTYSAIDHSCNFSRPAVRSPTLRSTADPFVSSTDVVRDGLPRGPDWKIATTKLILYTKDGLTDTNQY